MMFGGNTFSALLVICCGLWAALVVDGFSVPRTNLAAATVGRNSFRLRASDYDFDVSGVDFSKPAEKPSNSSPSKAQKIEVNPWRLSEPEPLPERKVSRADKRKAEAQAKNAAAKQAIEDKKVAREQQKADAAQARIEAKAAAEERLKQAAKDREANQAAFAAKRAAKAEESGDGPPVVLLAAPVALVAGAGSPPSPPETQEYIARVWYSPWCPRSG